MDPITLKDNPAFQAFDLELRALIARTPQDILSAWEKYYGLWNHPLSAATTPYSYDDLREVFEAHRLSPFQPGIIINIYHPRDRYFDPYRYEVHSVDVGIDRWVQIDSKTGISIWLVVESSLGSTEMWILKATSESRS